jgi:hypothetical protein
MYGNGWLIGTEPTLLRWWHMIKNPLIRRDPVTATIPMKLERRSMLQSV